MFSELVQGKIAGKPHQRWVNLWLYGEIAMGILIMISSPLVTISQRDLS